MSRTTDFKYVWGMPTLFLVIFMFITFENQHNNQIQQVEESKLEKIVIAVPDLGTRQTNSSGNLVIDHLLLNHLLEQQLQHKNIKVEWKFFKGAGPAINEALVNKQVDLAFLGDLAAIVGKANHIDTRLIVATGRQMNVYLGVLPNQGYRSLQQLKGKRIAVWQGTALQLSFDQFIQSYGFSEKDFRIVNLDPAAMNAALAAKQVDAGWGSIGILALHQKGLLDIPLSSHNRPEAKGTLQSGLIARQDFIENHPEATQEIVNVVIQSAHWLAQPEHRDQAIQEMTKNAGYPLGLYEQSIQGQALKQMYSPLLDQAYLDYFQSGVNVALKAKLIKNSFTVQDWIESRFINQGVDKLNYTGYWD